MKIYLYNLWSLHSRLYCTVPHCPSIYAYIIVTLRESIESLERECGLCILLCGREMSLGFCSFRSSVPLMLCLSFNPVCRHLLRLIIWEAFFFSFFSIENTACTNCKKNICFGTDLHCSNVHSLISMAKTITANTSGPLWYSLAQYTVTDRSRCLCIAVSV